MDRESLYRLKVDTLLVSTVSELLSELELLMLDSELSLLKLLRLLLESDDEEDKEEDEDELKELPLNCMLLSLFS